MIKANFNTYASYVTDSLYQWDLNQVLRVTGLNLSSAPEVHFHNANMDKAIVRQATYVNHVVNVNIPNSLLQDPLTIEADIGIYESKTFKVVEKIIIPVIPKKRPADYQIQDSDEEIYSFNQLLNALGNKANSAQVANIIAHNNDTDGNTELVDMRTDINGKLHKSAGDAVRYGSNRSQPLIYFPGGHFNYDTTTYRLSYVVDDSSYQIASIFNGKTTDNLPFKPTVTEFNIAENIGALQYIIINVKDGSLRSVNYKDYTPNANDYILVAYIKYKIYPVSLSPLDFYENGFNKYANIRDKGLLQTIGSNVIVDMVNGSVTLPATNFYKNDNTYGYLILSALTNEKTIDIALSSSVLRFVCYNITDQTLRVVERQYQFKTDEYCLFGVCSGEVIPIEINPACVTYEKGLDTTSLITVNDMLSPMFNNDKSFKIVLGGDSITHGVGGTGFSQDGDVILSTSSRTWYRNTSGYCWAKLFKEHIEDNYKAIVTNNGCSGSNSDIWNDNKETLIPSDTDLCILTIGTNDRNARDGVTTKAEALSNYYDNITSIVKYCHSNNIDIILVSPIPASSENEAEDRLCHIYELNGILQKVASENNIEYINLYSEIYYHMLDHKLSLNDYLGDGLHPNDSGYKLMYYKYMKLLNLAPSYVEVT